MSLYLYRHGESARIFHRATERVYRIEDEWYFTIRRGVDQGPYRNEHEARQALIDFVREQLEFEEGLHFRTDSLPQ